MEYRTELSTPLGVVLLTSDREALTGLWFTDERKLPQTIFSLPQKDDLRIFLQTEQWLNRYFSGAENDPLPPLRPKGTAFQERVWELLREIPRGTTVSYGQLAARLNADQGCTRTSARAVGGAVGRNPISILIPCHRVIGADGSMTGYAGGIQRKRALLALEGVLPKAESAE